MSAQNLFPCGLVLPATTPSLASFRIFLQSYRFAIRARLPGRVCQDLQINGCRTREFCDYHFFSGDHVREFETWI